MTVKELLQHGLVGAIVGAVVGGVASALISWPISYNVAMSTIGPSQDRQMRLEAVTSFSAAADDFTAISTQIIPKLNYGQSLDETKVAIATASGKQAVNAQSLIDIFGPTITEKARGYQTALSQFVTTTKGLQNAEQVKEWATAFDQVLVAQRDLKASMNLLLKVEPMGASGASSQQALPHA